MKSRVLAIECASDASFAALFLQPRSEGGNEILDELSLAAEDDSDTYLLVCAHPPASRIKLFPRGLHAQREADPLSSLEALDTPGDGIVGRIHARLMELFHPDKPGN